ncbi:hypothetical protein ACMFMF_005203 [Clarireedia jacksonii]
MDPDFGSRTPIPRLIDIRAPRSPSTDSVHGYSFSILEVQKSHMNINPTLLPRRRTSKFHNQSAIDTVPEMRRFNSDPRLGTRSKSLRGNSQRLGTLDSFPLPEERESMNELADFLMYHPPPTKNLQPPTPEAPKRKFGLFRKKAKKEHKKSELLHLPDTTVAAITGKGVQYIAISIPVQHDYLGDLVKTGCPTLPESASEPRSPSSGNERGSIVVQKPVHKPKPWVITPPPDFQPARTNDSRSTRHSWAPGLAHNKGALEEAGSNAAMSLSGYFQYNQAFSPPTSIYAVEPYSFNGRSNTLTSSQVRRTSFQDARRTNSMGSVHRPIVLLTSKREGISKVVNSTPSPHTKPAHQSHKKSKSRSTVHSVASTVVGISNSLNSTPESFASSPTATVFGTAETVDLQSIRAGSSLPALSSTERSNPNLTTSRSHVTTIPATSPPTPQLANVDRGSEISLRTGRRNRVRARRERDLAELRMINTPSPEKPIAAPTHAYTQSGSFGPVASPVLPHFWTASGERRVARKPLDHQAGPSGTRRLYLDGSRSSPDLARSAKHQSSSKHHHSKSMKDLTPTTSKIVSQSRIMVVADISPSSNHFITVDPGFPVPHPKRSLKNLGKIAYSHNTTQTPSTSQTQVQHPPTLPPTPATKTSRLRPRPNSAPSPPSNTTTHLKLTRQDLESSISDREHELDVRLRIIERDTDVLLHTLGVMLRGLEEVADHPIIGSISNSGGVGRQRSAATTRTIRTSRTGRTGTTSSWRRKKEKEAEMEGREREKGMVGKERDMIEPIMREIQMLAPSVSMESLGGWVDEMVEDDKISL